MIKLLTNNPYRILGVFSNSPKKEVLSNLNKMKAFLKVGKSMSFLLDLPTFLPPIERTDVSVSTAQSAIELPVDQLKHTLFWFMKDTQFDEIAFNHLFSGNITQAKDIWSKKESVSSVLNLMACAMIEQDVVSLALNADKLFSNHATEFCQKVNETVKLTSDELTQLFVDSISEDSTFSISALANVSGTSSTWRNTLSKRLISPIIDLINNSIQVAKQASGPLANYNAGVKLMEETKQPLAQLKGLLGASDMQYQMIADKLANAILQCGINYFNDTEEDNAPDKAKILQGYALSISVGQMAKDRCKEIVNVLNSLGKEYKVRNEMAAIAKALKQFQGAPKDTSDIFSIICKTSISSIRTLLNQCTPELDAIKSKLGYTDETYINISSAVASAAINGLVEIINNEQKFAIIDSGREKLKGTVRDAMSLMSQIGNLAMSSKCRSYYNNNMSTLQSINSQLNPSGCYIATMAYGDYDHPQVLVLRKFRDNYLDNREWGKRFIKFYYAHSPNWVERLKNHSTINSIIRKCLNTFVFILKKYRNYE